MTLGQQRVSATARHIFETLRADIAVGRLQPRERLVEAELVDRFDSHRPAVREALSLLTQLGVIVHRPHKGASVAELSPEEITKIYDVRIELECLAARWMPLPLDAAALDELESIQDAHSTATKHLRYSEIFRLDLLFHATLNNNCGNRHLADVADLMSSRGLQARYSVQMDEKHLKDVEHDHLTIIAALRTSDTAQLVEAVRSHMTRGARWYADRLQKQLSV